MNIWQTCRRIGLGVILLVLAATPGLAQVPVDASGNEVGDSGDQPATESTGNEGIPLLSRADLQDLVGPVALYPDDLLAIVLPAATYPLQIVQAARFIESLKSNPSLEPDPKWDDSIVALLNYPEIIELLNEDLDWTWQLGEAVVAQQGDVVSAVEAFRNTAYAAGNLRSDDHQQVTRNEDVIEISPVRDDIIYVPYYEPEHVVVYQPRQVYYYHAQPRPVYYYPYPDYHAFNRGYFWGVTTAYSIGWTSDRVHVYHHSYHGHPYYGHHYGNSWWYRKPSISVHNTVYVNNSTRVSSSNRSHGDQWRPSRNTRLRHTQQRRVRNVVTNNRNVVHNTRNLVRSNANLVRSNANVVRSNGNVVRANFRRPAPAREARHEPRHESRRESRNVPRSEPRRGQRHEPTRESRNQARRESKNEARRDPKNESRREPKNQSRREPKNQSRRSRPAEQRQARNHAAPRRHKY